MRSERRPAGTGALFVRVDSAGRETWYRKWRLAGVQVKRTLGLRRVPGSPVGLTAREAEAALRRVMEATTARPPTQERLDFAEAATRYIAHAERVLRRKPTTIADYTSMARRHLGPFFGGSSIESIRAAHVTAYIQTKLQEGLAPKTVSNSASTSHTRSLVTQRSRVGQAAIPSQQRIAHGENRGTATSGSSPLKRSIGYSGRFRTDFSDPLTTPST